MHYQCHVGSELEGLEPRIEVARVIDKSIRSGR